MNDLIPILAGVAFVVGCLGVDYLFTVHGWWSGRFGWTKPTPAPAPEPVTAPPEDEPLAVAVAENAAGDKIAVPDKYTFTLRTNGDFTQGRLLLEMNWDPEFIQTLHRQGIDHVSDHECVVDFLVMLMASMVNQGPDETNPDRVSPVDKANRIVT